MEIDLKQINHFFENYKKTPMPKIVRDLVLSGTNFKLGELETKVIEWCSLRDIFSPDIAKKIDVPTECYNIVILRRMQTPEYFVYEPRTGEYVGQVNIK